MACKSFFAGFLFLFFLMAPGRSAGAVLIMYAQTVVDIELAGYDGLAEFSLFKESMGAGEKQEIDLPYPSWVGAPMVLAGAGVSCYPG